MGNDRGCDALRVDEDLAGLMAAAPAPAVDLMALPLDEARDAYDRRWAPFNANPPPLRDVQPLSIPRRGGGPAMEAVRYVPSSTSRGTILFAHGGGWRFGSPASHDHLARSLALAADAEVISIDYRLAPENPFPAALHDLLDALAFAAADRDATALAGDSAGASLCLGALAALRDAGAPMPAAAALFYGCFDIDFDTGSYRRFGDGRFGLSRPRMERFWQDYRGGAGDEAIPGRAELAGLPALHLHAAGLDVLLDDTMTLAQRAAAAGVRVAVDVVPGLVHGHLQMALHLPAAGRVIDRAAAFLREEMAAARS